MRGLIIDAIVALGSVFIGWGLYDATVKTVKQGQIKKTITAPIKAVSKIVIPSKKPGFEVPEKISEAEALAIIRDINRRVFCNFFDEKDVLAIIYIESSFRPTAQRHESHLNDHSIGLMQLLTSTAKDRGFRGTKRELMKPTTNILYGMKHLEWSLIYLKRRKPKVTKEEWISSYNMGVGNTMKGRLSANYIAKFKAARAKY